MNGMGPVHKPDQAPCCFTRIRTYTSHPHLHAPGLGCLLLLWALHALIGPVLPSARCRQWAVPPSPSPAHQDRAMPPLLGPAHGISPCAASAGPHLLNIAHMGTLSSREMIIAASQIFRLVRSPLGQTTQLRGPDLAHGLRVEHL